MTNIIKTTQSICPVCLKTIDANVIKENDNLYLQKICADHGNYKTIMWRGIPDYETWVRPKSPAYPKTPTTKANKGCPHDCGLCSEHRQHTCTVLIEVTSRCNLSCKFCFADSKGTEEDPKLDTIKMWYEKIIAAGGPYNLQISGGEPTVRCDLPEIIAMASKFNFPFIQLNTNGIRLTDFDYYKTLKDAGLSSIFLQFDGFSETEIVKIRGRELFEDKLKVIENSKRLGIGVILVCTVIPDINDNLLWDIIDFGMKHAPTVRGVHFQPVSYFGRIPKIPQDSDRITLPEVMYKITEQSSHKIKISDFGPSGCENTKCSFHANYILSNKELIPVTKKTSCGCEENGREGSRKTVKFVQKNWAGVSSVKYTPKPKSFDELLQKINQGFFSISGMAFQDAWNLDIDRLKDCCIHVVNREGNLIPFCAYNITSSDNIKLYR